MFRKAITAVMLAAVAAVASSQGTSAQSVDPHAVPVASDSEFVAVGCRRPPIPKRPGPAICPASAFLQHGPNRTPAPNSGVG
jgi:hypothetical protein